MKDWSSIAHEAIESKPGEYSVPTPEAFGKRTFVPNEEIEPPMAILGPLYIQVNAPNTTGIRGLMGRWIIRFGLWVMGCSHADLDVDCKTDKELSA